MTKNWGRPHGGRPFTFLGLPPFAQRHTIDVDEPALPGLAIRHWRTGDDIRPRLPASVVHGWRGLDDDVPALLSAPSVAPVLVGLGRSERYARHQGKQDHARDMPHRSYSLCRRHRCRSSDTVAGRFRRASEVMKRAHSAECALLLRLRAHEAYRPLGTTSADGQAASLRPRIPSTPDGMHDPLSQSHVRERVGPEC
jgi:hypothetical protein